MFWFKKKSSSPTLLPLPSFGKRSFIRNKEGIWELKLPTINSTTFNDAMQHCSIQYSWLLIDPMDRLAFTQTLPQKYLAWRFLPQYPEDILNCLHLIKKHRGFDGILLINTQPITFMYNSINFENKFIKRLQVLIKSGIGVGKIEIS